MIPCVPDWLREADPAIIDHGGIAVEADARLREVQPHAVRADEVEVGFPSHGGELVLELDAELLAGLGEPAREEARTVGAIRDQVFEHVRGNLARHGDKRVIDRLGDVGHRPDVLDAERLDAGNLLFVELHRIERPALLLEGHVVVEPHVAGALVADNGDDLRVEHRVELVSRYCHG